MKKFFTKNNLIIALVIIVLLAIVFVVEGINNKPAEPVENQDISVEETFNPQQTFNPETNETQTPQPEETEEPSATPEPTKAPDNKPTAEPTDKPENIQTSQATAVPTATPEPVENGEKTCYLSVECKTVFNNMGKLKPGKESILPPDGVIFPKTKVTFYEGESVFNILLREMKKNKIHMEYVSVPMYNSCYIEGLNNLYEFDCGELSGWLYKVNGTSPGYGSSRYTVSDGDYIEWIFTCDLGRDVGGNMNKSE